jgi:hypothetical protein
MTYKLHIKPEIRESWEHELNILRGFMRGLPITPESNACFRELNNKLTERMILDILDQVIIPLEPGYCRYRKGWSDERVSGYVNSELKAMCSKPTPDRYLTASLDN